MSESYPNDRRYSEEHEWVKLEGDEATVGITDFAQDELGDVVFVELPEVGREVEQGDEIGTIESVKAVAEIYSPIGGTISEINEDIADAPELLNESPHEEGWLVRVTPSDRSEIDSLMEASAYQEFTGAS